MGRQEAIILSMSKKERVQVGLLNASRRKRIAAGSGTTVQDVNRVVKQYQDMAKMMKKMGSKAGSAGLKALMGGGMPGNMGGMMSGNAPSAADMAKLSQKNGGGSMPSLPGLG